jgi:hypothetical protein
MKGGLLAVVAVLCAAAAASAASPAVTRAELALMPLSKSALGPAAAGLPLNPDSGVVTAKDAADGANGDVTAAQVRKLGFVAGYSLDYSDQGLAGLSRGHGLIDVDTEVGLYSSDAAAERALAFWRKDDTKIGQLASAGIHMAVQPATVATLGKDAFAYDATIRIGGKPPIYALDAYFRAGPLLAELSLTAADRGTLTPLAARLIPVFRSRIADVLSGRINGKPVPLTTRPAQKAGPPANGPALDALALSPSDVGGGNVTHEGYVVDKDFEPISEYVRSIVGATPFASIQEQVMYFHSAAEAGLVAATIDGVMRSSKAAKLMGVKDITSFKATPVPVKAGDESHAVIARVRVSGASVDEALVEIRVGRTMEFIAAAALPGRITSDAVVTLAQQAAQKAAAGLKK